MHFFKFQCSKGKNRWIFYEFETTLVYRVSSRLLKATHRKPNNHKQKRKEQREPDIVVHVYNSSTKQSDARVSITSSKPIWST